VWKNVANLTDRQLLKLAWLERGAADIRAKIGIRGGG
jgi:hypothetical protein